MVQTDEVKNYWNKFPNKLGKWLSFDDAWAHFHRTDYFIGEYLNSVDVSGKVVLDLGCGPGVNAYYLARKGASRVVGLDVADVVISENKNRFPNDPYRDVVEFVAYDGHTLPFADGTFDVIFSSGAIHHAVDDRRVLEESLRCLKPNGVFIGNVYRKYSPGYFVRGALKKMDFLKDRIEARPKDTFLPEILLCPIARHYTSTEWRAMLHDAGAKDIETWPSYSGIARWAFRLGVAFDKITRGCFGYYVIWRCSK